MKPNLHLLNKYIATVLDIC